MGELDKIERHSERIEQNRKETLALLGHELGITSFCVQSV
jgi:hypothetical protein